jgi:Mrp family chromosome partitioning ATPase
MSLGLLALAEVWRHRKPILLPTLVVPLLAVGFSLSQPPVYRASALLQLDVERVKSPLLQKLEDPANTAALQRIITGQELLRDTAHEAGMRLDPKRVELEVVSDRLIRVGYHSPQKLGLEALVDALAYNFIYEVLAPERLRTEQRLTTTAQSLQEAERAQNSFTPGTSDYQKASAQVVLLRQTYQDLLAELTTINAAFEKGNPNAILWFAEAAQVEPRQAWLQRTLGAAGCGLVLGFLAGLGLVLLQRVRPRGFASTTALSSYTQLPVVGGIPNLGTVTIEDGKASVTHGPATLNPADFTEVSRLHRALMRNLHGALVLTSTAPNEGTSLIASLLALRSAAGDKRTLLVDLNLRNGGVSSSFGQQPVEWGFVAKGKGPRGKAAGSMLQDAIVENVNGSGLDVLPLPSDAKTLETLGTAAGAQALLDGLSSAYEHIVVDTSPLSAANRHNADPLMLAAAAPKAALVVLMRRTGASRVKQAADALTAAGADLAGVIANNLYNPSPRTLLLQLAGALPHGLGQWLRAKVIKSGLE